MAIAFISASDSNGRAAPSSITFAHTIAAGSERALVVFVVGRGGTPAVSGVTYSGVAMTLMGEVASNGFYAGLFVLVAPAVGTADVVASFSTAPSTWGAAAAQNYTGVDQTTPQDTAAVTNTAATGTSATNSITTANDGAYVVGGIGTASNSSLTASNGQTVTMNEDTEPAGASAVDFSAFGYLLKATAGIQSFGWSWGSNSAWSQIVGALRPAGAGGGQTIAAGLNSETDSAFALGALKTRAVGLNAETDSAQAVTPVRLINVGLTAEIDDVFAVTGTKARFVGLNTETDSALAAIAGRSYAVGIVAEADSAFSVSKIKTLLLGVALEIDSSLTVAGQQSAVALRLLRRAMTSLRVLLRRG